FICGLKKFTTRIKVETRMKKPKKVEALPHSPRIAAIQMESTPDREKNLAQARGLLDEALKHDPNIVAFPENMTLLTSDANLTRGLADTLRGPTIEIFQEWAAEGDVWLLAGTVPIKAPGGKVFNT